MKAIVTAANGDIAEAVSRTLREAFPGIEIVGTEIEGDFWPALDYCDRIIRLPHADDPSYYDDLEYLIMSENADIVLPLNESELRALATRMASGASIRYEIAINSPDTILRFTDKLATAEWLFEKGLPCPRTWTADQADSEFLPLIFKPRHGSGSKGIFFAHTSDELVRTSSLVGDDYVAQSLIDAPDQEHTAAVFRWGGTTRVLIMWRQLRGGMSSRIRTVRDANIEDMLVSLAEAIELQGCLNVQYRLENGRPVIFEINPRLSSTVRMRHLLGFTDLVWLVDAKTTGTFSDFATIPPGREVLRLSRERLCVPTEGQKA